MVNEATSHQQDISSEINTRLRDLEERQRLLKDRVILLGKTLIKDRDKTFSELQEIKKTLMHLQEDNREIKNFIRRASEKLENVARKEELMILQRQFDLFREQ